MTPNICSYTNVKFGDIHGINDRFRVLFKDVCYLLANSSGSTPTLQEVTTAGFTTTNPIITTSLLGIRNSSGFLASIVADNLTANRTIELPDGTGILMLQGANSFYKGLVDGGQTGDPVSSTSSFTNTAFIGLGTTTHNRVIASMDGSEIYNFGASPSFSLNASTGLFTLLSGTFTTGSVLILNLNQ